MFMLAPPCGNALKQPSIRRFLSELRNVVQMLFQCKHSRVVGVPYYGIQYGTEVFMNDCHTIYVVGISLTCM